ncbi:MAG: hypothetical protein ACMUIL_06995 [bacterium]
MIGYGHAHPRIVVAGGLDQVRLLDHSILIIARIPHRYVSIALVLSGKQEERRNPVAC